MLKKIILILLMTGFAASPAAADDIPISGHTVACPALTEPVKADITVGEMLQLINGYGGEMGISLTGWSRDGSLYYLHYQNIWDGSHQRIAFHPQGSIALITRIGNSTNILDTSMVCALFLTQLQSLAKAGSVKADDYED